jgi:ParB-like chromosome segregation protein Spo0J
MALPDNKLPEKPVEPAVKPAEPLPRPSLPTYEAHPLADIFPKLMEVNPTGYRAFVDDIKARGQQEPITIHEGKILDGRNRYDACVEHHLGVKTKLYEGDDPIGFVLSANLHRRHLNESQRAMVAAKLATLSVGANQHSEKEGTPIGAASKILSVGRGSIDRAKVVLKSGNQALIKEVEKGETSVSKAANQVKTKGKTNAAAAPPSISASEAYDKVEKDLIKKLKDLAPDEAEAAAAATIEQLNETVATMLKAAKNAEKKKAA